MRLSREAAEWPHRGRGQRMGPRASESRAARRGAGPGNTEGVWHRGQGAAMITVYTQPGCELLLSKLGLMSPVPLLPSSGHSSPGCLC